MTQSSIPLEVMDLLHFLNQKRLNIATAFKADRGSITRQEFESCLKTIGYVTNKLIALEDALSTTIQNKQSSISLDKLAQFASKFSQQSSHKTQITQQMARDMY